MIRPFTGLCMLAALGSILYMFQAKHRSEVQDREIMQTIAETRAAQQRVAVLKAQYAGLSDDQRLIELSDRFLTLKSTQPTQFVQLADLASRLPAPRADMPEVGPADEDAAPEAAEPPAPVASASPHVVTAAARAAPHPAAPAVQPAAQPQPRQAPAVPRIALANPAPARPAVAPVSAPVNAPVVKARTAPRPPVGAPVYRTAATGPTASVSALGGFRGELAAPVPIATPER